MDPPKITHIISNTIDFIEHDLAIKSMIPIVTPSWVYDSLVVKMQNIRTYNPDPAYFSKIVLYVVLTTCLQVIKN